LLGSLVAALKFNLDRKAARVRLFEVGRVFSKDSSVVSSDTTVAGFHQPMRVAGICQGSVDALQWGVSERAVDFFDVKGDVQALLAPRLAEFRAAEHPAMHPGRCAAVWLDGQCIGHLGEMHPRWRQQYDLAQAPIFFELDWAAVLQRPVPEFKPVSRHQAVERDLAIVVQESVTHDAVMQAIRAIDSAWLKSATLFDVYRPKVADGQNEKSLAVRLVLNRDDATLTDEAIESTMSAVLKSLTECVGARLRA
jgi:phenylalanyl-tRNA synthetase beta chain